MFIRNKNILANNSLQRIHTNTLVQSHIPCVARPLQQRSVDCLEEVRQQFLGKADPLVELAASGNPYF